jgi:hypothetical protein
MYSFDFKSSSAARSGDAVQYGSSIGAPFNVNFGNGVTQGGGVPGWVWVAGLVVAGLWLWKRSK